MDIMILLGIVIASLGFFIGVPELRVDYALYLKPTSFILVFFGTVASTMISTNVMEFKKLMKVFKGLAFGTKAAQPHEAVQILIRVSEKAQTVTKQDLVKEGANFDDGFLERGLGLVAAGLDKDFVRRTLETDVGEIERRHGQMINMVRTMGVYAPMFGMTGTVLGVTQVLKNVTDIENIVAGMSLALLTTLYGLILSTVLFNPLSNKLQARSNKELLTKEIIMEGILAIMDKEIPLKVEKYLAAYLDTKFKSGGQ